MTRVARTVVAGSVAVAALAGLASANAPPVKASLLAYRGLGTWVDIYDTSLWNDPLTAVQSMQADGIRTVYLQSSNYSHRAIVFPLQLGTFIEAAHAAGLRVVAWYLPSLADVNKDFQKSMAAIQYRSAGGQGVDSFALDIEARVVTDPTERTARLLALSQRIRDAVGPSYPLGAITPSSVNLAKSNTFWPDFPYQQLGTLYNVFLPMCYSGSVANGEQAVHDYAVDCAGLVRTGVGNPSVPIHEIGGVANNLNGAEIQGFVDAVREYGLVGGSLYDFMTTVDPAAWDELRTIPANPKQSPALPLPIGAPDAVGNLPNGDRSHPKDVVYLVTGAPGAFTLTYQAFDIGAGEVTFWVNWQTVRTLRVGPARRWSLTRRILIPDELVTDAGLNVIGFTAVGDFPTWSTWGVRQVTLSPA
jgi:hypothetical protein